MAKTYVLYTWHEIYQLLRFIEIDGISINMLHDYIYLIYQNIKLYIYIICKLYIYILCVYVIVKWCTIMLVSIYLHFITIHNNSFDNQRSEINKNDIFYVLTVFYKNFLPTTNEEICCIYIVVVTYICYIYVIFK